MLFMKSIGIMDKEKQMNNFKIKKKKARTYLPEVILGVLITLAFFSLLLILLQ